MKNWRMKGWDGIQSSLSSRSSSTLGNQASSRTVRLGRVQPQAPTHRTIFCNDREANLPIRFKVQPFSSPISFFWFHFVFVFCGWLMLLSDCVVVDDAFSVFVWVSFLVVEGRVSDRVIAVLLMFSLDKYRGLVQLELWWVDVSVD